LGVLRRGYRLAVMKLRFSPYYVPVFPEFPASAPRTGYVVESEMMRIIEATKQTVLKLLFFFAYLTSYRKSEILNLQWNQVNWETGELWLRKGETKNGEARCFPFGVLPELKELLEKQRAITDECQQRLDIIIPWVFHREGKQIREFRRAWKTAVKNAGLTPRLFHDLRRSATRYLVKAGIPSKTAQMITGHKDRGVFEKYNIVDNPDLAEGIQRYAEYREKLKAEAQKKVAVGSFGT
jgi:integrase